MTERTSMLGAGGDAAEGSDRPRCDYCGRHFKPVKQWQKFCHPDCRRAFWDIINGLLADIRPAVVQAARNIAEARREGEK